MQRFDLKLEGKDGRVDLLEAGGIRLVAAGIPSPVQSLRFEIPPLGPAKVEITVVALDKKLLLDSEVTFKGLDGNEWELVPVDRAPGTPGA